METEQEEKKCVMAGSPPEPDEGDETPVLTRDQILDVNDIQVKLISIPEWNGSSYIRTFMAGEWDDFENDLVIVEDGIKKKAAFKNYRAKFAVMILCDQYGNKLFDKKDIPALTKKSRAALDRILLEGKKFNNISEEDEAGLVENLEQTPNGDS